MLQSQPKRTTNKQFIQCLLIVVSFLIIFVVIMGIWLFDPSQRFISFDFVQNINKINNSINNKTNYITRRHISREIWMRELRFSKYKNNDAYDTYITENWNESLLASVGITISKMKDICRNTYFNTIETTVKILKNEGTVFIITGDIKNMWIRDSTEQIMQYAPLMNSQMLISSDVSFKIKYLFCGLILKQAQYIIHDPYANSYHLRPSCYNYRHQRLTNKFYGFIATRDFELDNGAYFVKLLYIAFKYEMYHVLNENIVIKCIKVLFSLWEKEQKHNVKSQYKPHIIDPERAGPQEQLNISNYIGMIYTARRPSDDRVKYGYHIPDNLFLHHILKYLIEINNKIWKNNIFVFDNKDAIKLRTEIWQSVHEYGVYNDSNFGLIYCYETDGFGNCNMMDDANVPNLLSIPYYTQDEYDKNIFNNTIRFILSDQNRYYFVGKYAKGIGSGHTRRNYVWPLGLTSQIALLNDNKYKILSMIVNNTGNTLYMHESFNVNNPNSYSRSWFAWANSYFSIFANCLNQFIDKNDIINIMNKHIQLNNITYTQINILNDDDYGFNPKICKTISPTRKCV